MMNLYTVITGLRVLLCALLLTGCQLYTDSGSSKPDDADKRQARQIMEAMSLQEKIGQLFYVSAHGSFMNRDSEAWHELESRVRDYSVGGLVFFDGDVYGQVMLTNKLQQISDVPLWITQDMEYGPAMRLRDATRLTPAMGVAATGNPRWAYEKGRITAREAAALGVHQVFAPVVDVNNNPSNPIINVRAYSGDPDTVSTYANAFIQGMQSEGILATAKHFPGHGDTDIDSHVTLPVMHHDLDRLNRIELKPFRQAIGSGVHSIMSAHISLPTVGSYPSRPGTLDPVIMNHMLRDSLGFDGLVVTDALEMQGIASQYSPGEAVVLALEAGADMLLISPDLLTAYDELEQAVRRGRIPEERIDESVHRILSWKVSKGLFDLARVDVDKLDRTIDTREHRHTAGRIARESITLLKNENGLVPVRPANRPRVQVIALSDDDTGRTGSSLARAVRDYHPDVGFRVFDRRTSQQDREQMLREARQADLVILGSYIRVRTAQDIQLRPEHRRFLSRLRQTGTDTALLAFGNPYVFSDYPDAQIHMTAWSGFRVQVRAAVDALFGGTAIGGRLPIDIPGLYDIGDGIHLEQQVLREKPATGHDFDVEGLQRVDRVIHEAIRDSVFPGASLAVVHDGVLAYHRAYGYHDYRKRRPVRPHDVYDLASLTKMVGTTTAVMRLVEEGELSLNDRLADYDATFGEAFDDVPRNRITIRHLLTHTSGLPAFRIYVDEYQSRPEILEAVQNEPLINHPGQEYVYSDLGFILLGHLVEQITGESLDRYLRRTFFYPMGMQWTMFNPHRRGPSMLSRIPPTEIDTMLRDKEVHGYAHDERAYYMDGMAGHAGLFGTSRDLARYAHMLLNGGQYGGRTYLDRQTIETFTSRQDPPAEGRGLGFKLKNLEGTSTSGTLSSDHAFGHTGFTGTSLWMDPDRDTAVILLTNRTWPHRSYGQRIGEIRNRVADIVYESLENREL